MERSSFVQELLDEHIFIQYENEVYLYRKDLFQEMDLSSTYDNYGQIVGHEAAGDNQCTAFIYWNGSNFNTLLLSSDNPNFTVEEQLTEEQAAEVAAIIEQAEDNDNYVNQGGAMQTMVGYYIVEKDIAWVGSPQSYSVINTEWCGSN